MFGCGRAVFQNVGYTDSYLFSVFLSLKNHFWDGNLADKIKKWHHSVLPVIKLYGGGKYSNITIFYSAVVKRRRRPCQRLSLR